jgi:hypothetical protein
MPFDVYSGTLSQYVDRLVNMLTSMTNSPFTLVATWDSSYKWYALQYTDPDGYTQNNVYIIIGPNAFRATTRNTVPATKYLYSTCTSSGDNRGRPGNFYGLSVVVANQFDSANFVVPSTAKAFVTYALRAYRVAYTRDVSATACNDTTVPYTYEDLQSTFYTWYDKYGFVVVQQPASTAYPDVPFLLHVYRLTPFNTSLTFPWWVSFVDQAVLDMVVDNYYTRSGVFPPYPTNMCSVLPYTTSATGYGICMDNPTALNIPSGVAGYLTGTGTYPHTFASWVRQTTRPCPSMNSEGPRAPRSLYGSIIRRPLDPNSSYCAWMPHGEVVMLPSSQSTLDNYAYLFNPVVNLSRGVHQWSLTGVFARVTALFPISYVDSGISPGDVISTQTGEQYIALPMSNIESTTQYGPVVYDPCLATTFNDNNTYVNMDYALYAIRYA